MRSYLLLALSIIGIVVLSGCLGQTVVTGGKGLSISSFAPDFSGIRSGEPVYLSAMVTNVGEYDATGVSAQLFGINIGGTEWTLSSTTPQTQTVSMLRRSDPTMNLPGESQEFTWNLNSPANLLVDNTYTANIRVYYKYGTETTALLKFITYDYLKSLPSADFTKVQSMAGVSHISSSIAPISVSMNVGDRPLVVYKDGDQFMVQILVSNADVGNPFAWGATYPPSGTLTQNQLYKVRLAITSDLSLNCANSLGGMTSGDVTLTKGQSKSIFCTATISSASGLGNMRDYGITVAATYGYYIDSSTDIQVLRSEASLTGGAGGGSTSTTTTTTLPDCSSWGCTAWTNTQCGGDGCGAITMYQTRTCTPSGCVPEGQCSGSCTQPTTTLYIPSCSNLCLGYGGFGCTSSSTPCSSFPSCSSNTCYYSCINKGKGVSACDSDTYCYCWNTRSCPGCPAGACTESGCATTTTTTSPA